MNGEKLINPRIQVMPESPVITSLEPALEAMLLPVLTRAGWAGLG